MQVISLTDFLFQKFKIMEHEFNYQFKTLNYTYLFNQFIFDIEMLNNFI